MLDSGWVFVYSLNSFQDLENRHKYLKYNGKTRKEVKVNLLLLKNMLARIIMHVMKYELFS